MERKYIQVNASVIRTMGLYTRASKKNGKRLINAFAYAFNQLLVGDTLQFQIKQASTEEERTQIQKEMNLAFTGVRYVQPEYVVRVHWNAFNFDICNRPEKAEQYRLKQQFKIIADLATSFGVLMKDPKDKYKWGNASPIFSTVAYCGNYVYLHFNTSIVDQLLDKSLGYGLCYLDIILTLGSSSAGSLLIFLCRYLNAIRDGHWKNGGSYNGFSVDTVFDYLGLDLIKQDRGDNSTRFDIIDNSIKEINNTLDLGVAVEKIYTGKTVTSLKFTIEHPEKIAVPKTMLP